MSKELLSKEEVLHDLEITNYDEYLEDFFKFWDYSDIYNLYMKKEELVLKWNKAVSSLRRQNKRLSELEEALEQANNRIKELEEENRWRDVNEDGNPTSDGLYNVIRKGYGLLSLNWNSHYDVWDDYENDDFECNPEEITHWKPITLPNKEEK